VVRLDERVGTEKKSARGGDLALAESDPSKTAEEREKLLPERGEIVECASGF